MIESMPLTYATSQFCYTCMLFFWVGGGGLCVYAIYICQLLLVTSVGKLILEKWVSLCILKKFEVGESNQVLSINTITLFIN